MSGAALLAVAGLRANASRQEAAPAGLGTRRSAGIKLIAAIYARKSTEQLGAGERAGSKTGVA